MPQPANIDDDTDRGASESSEGFGLLVGDMIAAVQQREAQDSNLSPRRRGIQAGRKEHTIRRKIGYTRPDNEGSSSTTKSTKIEERMDKSNNSDEESKGLEDHDNKCGTAHSSASGDPSHETEGDSKSQGQ